MAARGFLELLRLARQGDKHQQAIADSVNRWSGIAFEIQGQSFVVPLGEVAEVIYCPVLTPIPNGEPWLEGLANIRGQLLTVIDLQEYLLKIPTKRTRQQKLLCLQHQDHYLGLMVDQVLGIQHFNKQSFFSSASDLNQSLDKYCSGYFNYDQKYWHVFLFSQLIKDFKQVNAVLS
ncbi:chemotaxis protein CheW [Acinetobacter nectaris]|uniref:chemotaxis protein CheW n=1 Tax=Acinetobacter nectaris TaxID=1219382 RepID=UPI001F2BD480|nr:chemotaxis protein CheW [Acinetobacter nectaris]MCF9000196.1 purine-binding chemotaxis protein CheW [Acinetobacter nectaris]MCF9028433.1 purine-binding chemotaxis protein CheW [Acinetobacter nectaris]